MYRARMPEASVDEDGDGTSVLTALTGNLDVIVRVLGDIECVRAPDGDRLNVPKQKSLEAVTYLALRESRVDREDVIERARSSAVDERHGREIVGPRRAKHEGRIGRAARVRVHGARQDTLRRKRSRGVARSGIEALDPRDPPRLP